MIGRTEGLIKKDNCRLVDIRVFEGLNSADKRSKIENEN